MQQLINHTKESNAYVVKHYPFNYGTFNTVRFWVETNQSYGQRVMKQSAELSSSISNLKWSKPKASSFSDIVILAIEDNPDSLQYGMVSPIQFDFANKAQAEVQAFSEYFYFDQSQRDILLTQLGSYRGSTYRTNFKEPPAPWVPLALQPIGAQAFNQPIQLGPNFFGKQPAVQPVPSIAEQAFAHNEASPNLSNQPVSDDIYAAAELVKETWEGWPYDQMIADPEGWLAHKAIRDNAYTILGIEIPGKPAPLDNADLKRNG